MKITKEQKGITLVALIITIVVLLILAVTTIGLVRESGIIGYAQNAGSRYNQSQEKEQIGLAISDWKIQRAIPGNTKTFKEVITNALKEQNASVSGEENGPLTLIMQSGRQYMITNSGEFFTGWYDNGDGSYTKGDTTVKVGETTYTNAEVLAKLGIKKSEYEGTYGSKTGETWTVIGVEGDKIKLVSTKNVASSVKLGCGDPRAIAGVTVEDESSLTKEEKTELQFKRSIWSYNHAIGTLNAAVEKGTKGIPGARSITIEDIEAKDVLNITDEQKRTLTNNWYGRTYRYFYVGDAETGKIYSQYLEWNETDTEAEDTAEEGWSNKYAGGDVRVFKLYDNKVIDGTDANKNNVVKLKHSDYRFSGVLTDTKFASSLGKGGYWIASLCVNCDYSYYASFNVCWLSGGIGISSGSLFNSVGNAFDRSSGVRAVVYI